MLYSYIKKLGIKRLAIIGLAKHAGKTTALNIIIEEVWRAGTSLSVQSIGVDGERIDALVGVEKPAVWVPQGNLLATAADTLEQGTARLEVVETSGIPSPLGELCIARVAEPGSVLLAGVRQVANAQFFIERFEKLGASLHLIDGAFDRMASATADLADGIVLCTGASVGVTIEDIVQHTRMALAKLQMETVQEEWGKQLIAMARATGKMTAGGPDREPVMLTGANPVLQHPLADRHWLKGATAIALPGAVTDRILAELEGIVPTLLIKDGTHMMASLSAWKRFARRGTKMLAERSVPIAAITVNPYSVTGYRLPAKELLSQIRKIANGIPVVDCLAAGGGE